MFGIIPPPPKRAVHDPLFFVHETFEAFGKSLANASLTFRGGGIIPKTRTVTYRANGQRVSSNGIF